MSAALRTVLIGAGKIGIGYAGGPAVRFASHASVLSKHPAYCWEAVVDPSPAARERALHCWGVRIAVASVQQLVAQYQPEVAVLATPPGARLEIIQGLPGLRGVLVEKPLGFNCAEAQALVSSCGRRGIPLQVNLLRRADEQLRALAASELEALIGKPQCTFGVYGNGLLNNGVHLVDLVRMLLGEIESVEALGPAVPLRDVPVTGDVHIPFVLKLRNGSAVVMHPLGFESYRENGLDIWGTQARLSIIAEGRRMLFYPPCRHPILEETQQLDAAHPRVLESTLGDAFYRMYDNLAEAIAGKAALWSSGESALATAHIIELVKEAAASRREIARRGSSDASLHVTQPVAAAIAGKAALWRGRESPLATCGSSNVKEPARRSAANPVAARQPGRSLE
jgi:predicted dehydrogenase